MPEFVTAPDGTALAFERHGEGPAIVLVHGFGSSRMQNWKSTGWYGGLTEAGFSIVAMDCRGHGDSGKPHDPAAYGHDRMAGDVTVVMDACGLARALILGYSMGGFIGLRLLAAHPDRVIRLAIAGVGANYLKDGITSPAARSALADALLVADKDSITDPRARMFRAFADQPGKDRLALAACMRAMSPHLPIETLSRLQAPILVVDGSEDETAGRAEPLAQTFLNGRAVTIQGLDHMSAVGDRRTRQAVIDFFR
ncbi:MAG TPA: alpha/beta fold hydrolase [Rhizomicrobium sp.]|jgi:pimeloyl-ACP methyl ester carboxylesterase|nr:alpha/beta fold hydrolase [Rhizomicrobium sp.]